MIAFLCFGNLSEEIKVFTNMSFFTEKHCRPTAYHIIQHNDIILSIHFSKFIGSLAHKYELFLLSISFHLAHSQCNKI